MMVRFSCFPTHIHCHRTKKGEQQCFQQNYSQDMHEDSLVFSNDQAKNVTSASATSILNMEETIPSNTHTNREQITSPSSFECCWNSEELNDTSYPGDEISILRSMSLKKSQSLGSGLDREGRCSCDVDTDDEIDQGLLPSSNFQDERFGRLVNLFENSGMQKLCGYDDVGINLLHKNQENVLGINADAVSNGSIFSFGDVRHFVNEICEASEKRSSDHVGELDHTSSLHTFSKSHSLPNLGLCESSPTCMLIQHRSRSVENLCTSGDKTRYFDGERLHSRISFQQYREASSHHGMSQTSDPFVERELFEEELGEEYVISSPNKECKDVLDKETDFMTESRNHILDNKFDDNHTSHNLSVSLTDLIEPQIDGVNHGNIQLEENSGEWHELNSKDFNLKRVEEWIRQIDIQDGSIPQEIGESSGSIPKRKEDSHLINSVNTPKLHAKGSGGVEVAYTYISSLAPASTSAQMTNLGLVAIPFLSAFCSLRVLNLSGNAIVRITSGALPRGLHMLNLSRNNISTIEGLRELTRLRVLDLSYNRISRIGHGLAACSSIKELYLAGNKISEVEGLHRLLKLNILDLRSNKISTAKSLGQLAANYASLQAINLEGNPAQRNVGEEQLKRYLLGLLPHLVYFNKHTVRASSMRDLSDRPTRSATPHQFERGLRSDHKRSRRGNHSTAASHKKVTSSSNHVRAGKAVGSSPKPSKHHDRRAHLPPAGSKIHPLPRVGSNLLSDLRPTNPIRRSRSEGHL